MSAYQSTKNFYDSYWSTRNDTRNRYRYKIFTSWIKDESTILDIGCGDGYLGQLLQTEKRCDVTCLDISEVALRKAKERGLKVVLGNAEEGLPFKDDTFDCVIATEVLEHMSSSEEVLKEIKRVSRGQIIVSIPNIAFWKYRLQLLFGRFPKQWLIHPMEHLRFWSIPDFRDMLETIKLQIVDIRAGAGRRYLRDWWPNMFAEQVCFKIKSQ